VFGKDLSAKPNKDKASYNFDFVLKERTYPVSQDRSAKRYKKGCTTDYNRRLKN
jgi:hypothetical protein